MIDLYSEPVHAVMVYLQKDDIPNCPLPNIPPPPPDFAKLTIVQYDLEMTLVIFLCVFSQSDKFMMFSCPLFLTFFEKMVMSAL